MTALYESDVEKFAIELLERQETSVLRIHQLQCRVTTTTHGYASHPAIGGTK